MASFVSIGFFSTPLYAPTASTQEMCSTSNTGRLSSHATFPKGLSLQFLCAVVVLVLLPDEISNHWLYNKSIWRLSVSQIGLCFSESRYEWPLQFDLIMLSWVETDIRWPRIEHPLTDQLGFQKCSQCYWGHRVYSSCFMSVNWVGQHQRNVIHQNWISSYKFSLCLELCPWSTLLKIWGYLEYMVSSLGYTSITCTWAVTSQTTI